MDVWIEDKLIKKIAKNLGVPCPKTDEGRAALIRFLALEYERACKLVESL